MVTVSPNRSSLTCLESWDGSARNAMRPQATDASSPFTKCAASTWPFSEDAARSGRAGIVRLSAIAFLQKRIKKPRAIGFGAQAAAGLGPVHPAGNIEMQPTFGVFDKAVEEQGGGDGAGEIITGIVGEIGEGAVEGRFI